MLNLLKIKEIWKKYSVRLSDWMLKEIREEDFDLFWKRLAENIYSKKSLNDEGKVFLAAFFSLMILLLFGFDKIQIVHSEEKDELFNAQKKNKLSLTLPENEKKLDIENLNRYKLKSVEENCTEADKSKITSVACGKDDEKEIKKQEAERLKKLIPPKPKIRGPLPYVYEKDSLRRRVCNKKNDKPGKSDKNKGKHMDMECCLDPDEIPNPNCYYAPSKYGKYL